MFRIVQKYRTDKDFVILAYRLNAKVTGIQIGS